MADPFRCDSYHREVQCIRTVFAFPIICTGIHLVQFEVDHSMFAVATAMQTALVSRGFEVKHDPSPRTTAERSVANLTAQL